MSEDMGIDEIGVQGVGCLNSLLQLIAKPFEILANLFIVPPLKFLFYLLSITNYPVELLLHYKLGIRIASVPKLILSHFGLFLFSSLAIDYFQLEEVLIFFILIFTFLIGLYKVIEAKISDAKGIVRQSYFTGYSILPFKHRYALVYGEAFLCFIVGSYALYYGQYTLGTWLICAGFAMNAYWSKYFVKKDEEDLDIQDTDLEIGQTSFTRQETNFKQKIITSLFLVCSATVTFYFAKNYGMKGFLNGVAATYTLGVVYAFLKKYNIPLIPREKISPDVETPKPNAKWDETPNMPPHGIRLGQKNGSVFRYNGKTHLITFAQTRGGKGTTSIIPNLLEYDGPVFVIDPKGENVLNTIGYRKGVLGRNVVVLDPFNESGLANACFNPMDFIDPDNINDDCGQIAESLITTKSKDPFWDNCAKSLLTAAIFYMYQSDEIPPSAKNLVEVYDRTLIDRSEFFEKMKKQSSLHHTVRHAISDILEGADNTKAGIFSSLRENLSEVLNEDKIRENLLRSSFSIQDFLNGNTDIFLVLPLDKLNRYKKWLRLILSSTMKDLLRKHVSKDTRKKLFILDEFGNLGHLQILENAFTTIAGRNTILWPFIQSFQQLEKDYPDAWRTILSQAGLKEVFNLGDDNPAAEYVSKIIGNTTVVKTSISTGESIKTRNENGQNETENKGRNVSTVEMPLLPPDKVTRFDTDKKIILRQGKNPVQIFKTYYFQDPELSSKWKESLRWVMKNHPETKDFIASEYPQAYTEIMNSRNG